MAIRFYLTTVEGRFEEFESEDAINWDDLFEYAYGAGDDFSLHEPLIKVEIDGNLHTIEDETAKSAYEEAQTAGGRLHAIYTDSRSTWFGVDDHLADDTWFDCATLCEDMAAGTVDKTAFSYSVSDKMWSYKDNIINAGISCDVSSDETVIVKKDGQILNAPE